MTNRITGSIMERHVIVTNAAQDTILATTQPEDPFLMEYGISPHDAMVAWVDGTISTRNAMKITGSDTLFDLIDACISSDVSLEFELTEREKKQIDTLCAIGDLSA